MLRGTFLVIMVTSREVENVYQLQAILDFGLQEKRQSISPSISQACFSDHLYLILNNNMYYVTIIWNSLYSAFHTN